MSTYRFIDRVCAIVTVLSLLVTILFMNGEKLGIVTISDADAETYTGNEYFTQNDLNGSWDTSEATVITLLGDSAKISGNGAYWLNKSLVIAQSGQYVISGELTDGNIVVNAAQYSKIWIQLNGVNLCCSDDACIRVDQADKVFLTLAEGTENVLTGGETFSETALADGTNAVIFSHDDLTINGSGSLTVVASLENGITSKDDLILSGGTISVSAPGHGLRVNDHFHMTGASVTLAVEQDGIHCEGAIVISDGTLTITAGDDAIHSDTSVLILDGTVLVNDCYEGIEALTVEIRGGDTTIHSQDDGINANGNTGNAIGGGMDMRGGGREMSTNPPFGTQMPFDMDAATDDEAAMGPWAFRGHHPQTGNGESNVLSESTPSEATMDAGMGSGSQEGDVPSPNNRMSHPEGTNEARMNDNFGAHETEEASTEEQMIVSVEDTWILISGGNLTVLNESGRDADGIDSNGSITITGGTVRVSLKGSGGNNALDSGSESGGVMTISGGTIIACGDSAMVEAFEADSVQPSILYILSENAPEQSTVSLLDAEGKELHSESVPYSFSAMVISCPELTVGETYTIRIGDMEETVELTGTSVSTGEASGFRMNGGMRGRGGHGNSQMPAEFPADGEGFPNPGNMEGQQMPEGRFGPQESEQEETGTSETGTEERTAAEQTWKMNEQDFAGMPGPQASPMGENAGSSTQEQSTSVDSPYIGAVLIASLICLALGLAVAFGYRKSLNIDA